MGIMIIYHGYNNGYNNPTCNVHKNMGAHYTWENVVSFFSQLRTEILFSVLQLFSQNRQVTNANVWFYFLFTIACHSAPPQLLYMCNFKTEFCTASFNSKNPGSVNTFVRTYLGSKSKSADNYSSCVLSTVLLIFTHKNASAIKPRTSAWLLTRFLWYIEIGHQVLLSLPPKHYLNPLLSLHSYSPCIIFHV